MADEEANPFMPPTDVEPARPAPEPDVDPALNLQGDNYRSMSFDVGRKAQPIDWKTFSRWMAFGVTLLLALVFFVVWVMLLNFEASSGSWWALGVMILFILAAGYCGRLALRKTG